MESEMGPVLYGEQSERAKIRELVQAAERFLHDSQATCVDDNSAARLNRALGSFRRTY